MPLRSHPNSPVEYSKNSADCEQRDEKSASARASGTFDELLAEFGMSDDVVAESDIPEELIDTLIDRSDRSKNVLPSAVEKCPAHPSKNVPDAASKNVPSQKRRSASKDDKILRKVRGFVPGSGSADSSSLVSSPLCPLTTPLTTIATTPSTPPKPANDNLIPVWESTGDLTKAVFATLALQIAEERPVAFNFNLTPEAIATALGHSKGFLDRLKRDFDKELEKAGIELSYWFAVDVDNDRRLHLHGAFGLPAINLSVLGTLRRMRKLMKASWGKWSGPGGRKQLRFKNVYSDDWATYCMRNRAKVRKIIGCRTYTINQPLRREAKAAYDSARHIMRGKI